MLEDSAFENWYRDPDSQWLALLGDMGCGKSVTMSYVVEELDRRHKVKLPQPKTCYYFCLDEQAGQSTRIFSALILALCEQLSGLKKTFYEWYKAKQASGIIDPAASPTMLGEFLVKVLGTLDRPLFVVIDGLDECTRPTRSTLFDLLRTLTQKSRRIKVMLSSRPEEEILQQLGATAKIELKPDPSRDAQIVQFTVYRRLSYLSEEVKELIIDVLTPLAKGRAIWIAMIVEFIEIRETRAVGPMRRLLANIPLPERLSTLYATMVSRLSSNDEENRNVINAALWLLASSWRPLSIQELAWGVALAVDPGEITTVTALAEVVDSTRVIKLIYPFISRLDHSDLRRRQVQLAHQSVKEFISQGWTSQQDYPRNCYPMSKYRQVGTLEQYILDVCLDYLLLDEIGSISLFSEEQEAMNELPPETDLFDEMEASEYDPYCTWETWEENMIRYDPNERGFGYFFAYAASYWLDHLHTVQNEAIPQLEKIKTLCQAGSTRLDNWIKQNCRPDCAMAARFEFESRLYDPLSIIALYGPIAIFRKILEIWDFNEAQFLHLTALGAADQIIQWGDLSRLRILFSVRKFSGQLQNLGFFRLLIRRWSDLRTRHDDWDVAFELVELVDQSLIRGEWASELLCLAAGAGCLPIIQHLLSWAQHKPDHRAALLCASQWIGEAILANHTNVVEYLLGQEGFEAHVKHINPYGENILHLASKTCNPRMFCLLTPHLAQSIHQTDARGDTALMKIIENNTESAARYESARILLRSQSDVDWTAVLQNKQRNPLNVAVALGDTDMCHLLVCEGKMDPRAAFTSDADGQLVLVNEPGKNETEILDLLQACASHD